MGYYDQDPLVMVPPAPTKTVTFTDCDERNTDQLQVVVTTKNEVAFTVVGKKGGLKASVWLSLDDARALVEFLTS